MGESRTFCGGIDWLREHGITVIDLESRECAQLLGDFIAAHPEVWAEDIGGLVVRLGTCNQVLC